MNCLEEEGPERQGVPAFSVLRSNHEFRRESNELASLWTARRNKTLTPGGFALMLVEH